MLFEKIFTRALTSFCLIACLTSCHKDPDPVDPVAIDLSEAESANCYIATTAGQLYSFRADIMGNGRIPTPNTDNPDNVSLNVPSNAVAAILWMSPHDRQVISAPFYEPEKKTISFYASSYAGNAVIGLFVDSNNNGMWDADASEKIIWSWHIWCVNYDPSAEGSYHLYSNSPLRNTRVMDRNLGAYLNAPTDILEENIIATFGMMYQFGRKDPFPTIGYLQPDGTIEDDVYLHNRALTYPNNVWKETTSKSNASIEYVVNNPTTFINTEGEWLAGENSDRLWGVKPEGEGMNLKTIYDPCPPGWRVPSYDVFEPLTTEAGQVLISGKEMIDSQCGIYLNYAGKSNTYIPAVGAGAIYEGQYSIMGANQMVGLGSATAYYFGGVLMPKALTISNGSALEEMLSQSSAMGIRCVADE